MKKFKFQQGGSISKLGYSKDSPYKNRDYIIIDSNIITMKDTDKDLYGIPIDSKGNKGKPVLMKAGRKEPYVFKDAVKVLEVPVDKFKFKQGGKAVFVYSHLMNADNVKKILGRKPKLTEHHLDGYVKTKDKSGETVIKPDNKSTTKGMKFYVSDSELKKIDSKMKPYKRHQVGGDSTYSELYTYYNNGGEMKKFTFKKPSLFQQVSLTKQPKNYIVTQIQGKLTPLFELSKEGLKPMINPKEFDNMDDSTELMIVNEKGELQDKPFTKKQFKEILSKQKKYEKGGVSPNANMVLLDHQGNPQMYMEGGELIISIKESEKLIKMAQEATTEEDFYKVGKYMYEVRMAQRKRNKEY